MEHSKLLQFKLQLTFDWRLMTLDGVVVTSGEGCRVELVLPLPELGDPGTSLCLLLDRLGVQFSISLVLTLSENFTLRF